MAVCLKGDARVTRMVVGLSSAANRAKAGQGTLLDDCPVSATVFDAESGDEKRRPHNLACGPASSSRCGLAAAVRVQLGLDAMCGH